MVTVDQAGTGASGTFTVTVAAANVSTDTATGSAAGNASLTASGIGSVQAASHLIISGTYGNGAFTVTSETYSEIGSYSAIQNTTRTNSDGSNTTTNRLDANRSGNYTLTFSVAAGTNGQLVYTAYSYSATDSVHWYTSSTSTTGNFSETTTDSNRTITTTGSGSSASSTGSTSWQETHRVIYPMPGGSTYDHTWGSGYTNPISGSTNLPPVTVSTADWVWRAGTPNATDYTFHGVATQNGSLVESATSRVTNAGITIDVTAFNSTSQTSDSGHVVDNEPGSPASGTELFHRDETFAYVNDVTGNGSYVGGSANANYHAVEVSTFAAADVYTINNDFSTGVDDDGQAYSLNFNYNITTNGNGTITDTHDYHDSGAGLELTGGSIAMMGDTTVASRAWGTRNGQSFDNPSLNIETVNKSTTYPASPGAVGIADGLENAFPFRGMVNPGTVFIQSTGVQVANGVLGRGPQAWYNYYMGQAGKNAETKAGIFVLKADIMWELGTQPNGGNPPATATFKTLKVGDNYGVAFKLTNKLDAEAGKFIKQKERAGWSGTKLVSTDIEVTYAVDQAGQNPRSGNIAAHYKFIQNFSGTRAGLPITQEHWPVQGNIQFHDGSLEKKVLLR